MTSSHGPIVVGIDASPDSGAALRWAVKQARACHRPVRVIYAYPWLEAVQTEQHIVSAPELSATTAQAHAQQFVEQAILSLADDPELSIEAVAIGGSADHVLCRESDSAYLVVVGSRKLHAVGSYLLGSVGQAVANNAHCPTVVVRAEPDPGLAAEVVVGVSADASAEPVLAFAFEQASWLGARLRVVHGWKSPIGPRSTLFPLEFSEPNIDELSSEAAQLDLAELIAGWQDKFSDVEVISEARYGHPTSILVEESVGKQLLVVGNSTHHPLIGTVLGSVSLGVLHHAACPVAVVPLATSG
ncbi:MAG: universal stress protein [Jatrophihabitantaceae bacterium]